VQFANGDDGALPHLGRTPATRSIAEFATVLG
jgi:hypothetical protein